MPPPMHMVTTTCFAPRRLPSISAWPVRRGARHAVRMADRDRAAVDVQLLGIDAELVAAVDHLHGERFVQLPQVDVVDPEAVRSRAAAARRTPGRCPSRPARSRRPQKPRKTPSGCRPRFSASFASITTQIEAPSENWLALPAVMSCRLARTGLSAASPSSVVSGRLPSSCAA